MNKAKAIELTEMDKQRLQRLESGRTTSVRVAERAGIVLRAASGMLNRDIAAELGVAGGTVGCWRKRFRAGGVDALLKDLPRGGRKPNVSLTQRVIEATTQTTPPGCTHWGSRGLAKHLETSPSMVQRVWRSAGLKPHLIRTFKVSNDPKFAEKLVDVVGLYLNPPERALVFSVDEKSQIQALDRTQKTLPMYKGRGGTLTHDYIRNGTTTLFAAMNVLNGNVIGCCMPHHRHLEWIKFLKQIDRETAPEMDLHLIVDNYATHKHPRVLNWLKRHPRIHQHFIPTSSSWLNLIERWFREITEKRIRRGVFRSVDALIAAINDYLSHHNADPKPFVWTAKADVILAKVERARRALQKIKTE
jgi:transposase